MIRIRVNGNVYILKKPTREACYLAEEVFVEHLEIARSEGLFTQEDLLDYLWEKEIWNEEKQKLIDCLPKEIEEFKLKLYKTNFKSNEKLAVRKALATAKQKLHELNELYHSHDSISQIGFAGLAKSKYLIGASLYKKGGIAPAFDFENFWQEGADFLGQVMQAYLTERLTENDFRALALNEPWRSIWATKKTERSLFGIPTVDYSEEQRGLVGWSALYDSVYEHPECPSEEVIMDNDMMDGWLIDQKRQRDSKMKKTGDDIVSNEKIKNSEEVYIPVDTPEDARKVDELNDAFSANVKRQRFNKLRKDGEVSELEMPNTKRRLQMEMARKFASAAQ